MKTYALILGLLLAPFYLALGQTVIEVPDGGDVPEVARFLVEPDELLEKDVRLVEEILDQVDAWTTDSIVPVPRQHLSGIYGVVGRMFARYWERLDLRKRKYIGTSSRPFKIYDGFAKEVDMNIFLMPHLPKYVQMVRGGFDQAFERGRSEKHYRYDNPPFPTPQDLKFKDLGYLTVECEGTPHEDYRKELAEKFIPTEEGKHHLEEHGNFGVEHPSVGLYGAWAMDCNHNCRPEIHPMDWMWWLDFSEDRPGGPNAKSWVFGLIRDASKRFKDWTPGPISGHISIPLAISDKATTASIRLDHLVFDRFQADTLAKELNSPQEALPGSDGVHIYQLVGAFPNDISLQVKLEGGATADGLKCWMGNWSHDTEKGLLYGSLHLVTSVDFLYTGRLTVDFE